MQKTFFDDGLTLDFTIEARGPFQPLAGKYRLAEPERTAEWHFEAYEKAKDGRARHRACVKFVAEHVVMWEVPDRPINEDSVKKLPQPVVLQLCNLIGAYSFEERAADQKN